MTGSFPENKEILTGTKVTFFKDISKEELKKYPVRAYEGPVTVVEDPSAVNDCIQSIRKHRVIGFDTETKPMFRKNQNHQVALIQLAIPGEVFLFRIHKTGMPSGLISLFEDRNITKAGVSIHDDISRLKKLFPFEPGAFFELQEYSNRFGIESNSLRKLSAIILGFRVSKSQQLSNWENNILSEGQIIYAATDAWVCLEIFNKLSEFDNHD